MATKAKKPLTRESDKDALHPDAWKRFERAVDDVMKAPPKHRVSKKPPDRSNGDSKEH